MAIIDATILRGARVATKNIKHQLSGLLVQFPAVQGIHPGSINVELSAPLSIPKWDYITQPTPWWDEGPNRIQIETFGFLEINFEYPLNGKLYRSWLFDCYNSACHRSPLHHEIISAHIPGISYNQRCRLHLP